MRVLADAAAAGAKATDAEEAVYCVTRALHGLLGDRDAHLRPGNLKEGETPQFACGAFFVTPDGRHNMVFAPVNYGPTQRHSKIDVTLGHPGRVVATGQPMVLENTDEHQSFVKILQTFRAGSVAFAPLSWAGKTIGVIVCAAQARNTMSADDLEVHIAFTNLAAALWMAHDGPALFARLA